MSFIVRVTGIQDTAAYFQRVGSGIRPRVTEPATKRWARILKEAMVKRMHTRSGQMVASTRETRIQNGWAVIVGVGYAAQENMRPGTKVSRRGSGVGTPHAFVEPAVKETDGPGFQGLLQDLTTFLAQG